MAVNNSWYKVHVGGLVCHVVALETLLTLCNGLSHIFEIVDDLCHLLKVAVFSLVLHAPHPDKGPSPNSVTHITT